ncbi:hypothetical protein HYZ82_02630 [Candidatus Nomurabacteria bacterium]|nr:hypothetical protein [Candidatus Nomurabacteria bacterium]
MEITLFKKEHKFAKGERRLRIKFFWKLAVLFMLTVAVFSAFLGYYLFKQVNKEVVVNEADVISQTETVKKERIEKSLEHFNLREEKSNQILNSPAPVIDPSL